jgi:hypothetical protein
MEVLKLKQFNSWTTINIDSNLHMQLKLLSEISGKPLVQILRESIRPEITKALKIKTPKNMPNWTKQMLIDEMIQLKINELLDVGSD